MLARNFRRQKGGRGTNKSPQPPINLTNQHNNPLISTKRTVAPIALGRLLLVSIKYCIKINI